MVDFGRRLSKKGPEKKIHPVEIYRDLDRSSEAGPLRNIQEEVLNNWFIDYQKNKDVILKLHTGQGKTLVGLLILQSLLNQEKGPCVYVCPNVYLVNQTIEQARKFGIPVTIAKDTELPKDFLDSKKIFICTVQKMFNGLTKFGLNYNSIPMGGIILDDCHACIDSVKEAFTIKIPGDNKVYGEILSIFDEDLRKQGSGTFSEINNKEHDAFLPVPYWSWIDNSDKVTDILTVHRDEKGIKFQWPLLKDILQNCQCYISGKSIEISPYVNPIQQFGSFAGAAHRILMSATTMNDSYFIKGLNIERNAVVRPLTIANEHWSGEKMILIPSFIHESLSKDSIVNHFANPSTSRNFGIVALIPSFKQGEIYKHQGCVVAGPDTIDAEIDKLKLGKFEKPLVIVNRYDGIDLPDHTCRLLIVDSKPFSESLSDKYEEQCREGSSLTKIKIAQKIEQGLGRSVRGEKDYSVILLVGSDLVNFIRTPRNRQYFSDQTNKQIEIGNEIAELVAEDIDPMTTNMVKVVTDLIKQCITQRDPKWKQFYEEQMNKQKFKSSNVDITEILELEKKAEDFNVVGQHQEAIELVQTYINKGGLSSAEHGWYSQMVARFTYKNNKVESNQVQTSAFRKNTHLLKPKDGFLYKKIKLIDANRSENIRKWLKELSSHEEMMEKVNEIYAGLSFEETADHFEEAVKNLGIALGFESHRPDKESREGPDNLWALGDNEYILFECKNEVGDTRDEISKDETGQMNVSYGWFSNNYPGALCTPIMAIWTKNVSKQGAFTAGVRILRKGGLKNFRDKFKAFYEAMKQYKLSSLTDEIIRKNVVAHELTNEAIKAKYTEDPYQRR